MEQQSARHPQISPDVEITLSPHKKRNRIWEIDFLRGCCICLMVLDHLTILIATVFGPAWYGYQSFSSGVGDAFSLFCQDWYNGRAREIIHPMVLFVFFSISGISCSFSRSNAKRGGQLAVVALIYSLCSYAAQELGFGRVFVSFGVLHFLAVAILLYAAISFFAKKNKIVEMIASVAIIVTTLCLYFLYTPPASTPKIFAIVFPPYNFKGEPSLFYTQGEISPGDLFTLIPYLAFFFSGILLAPLLYPRRRSLLPCLDHAWNKPMCFVGRHALVVFVFHMVLLSALLAIISYLFITPGSFGF